MLNWFKRKKTVAGPPLTADIHSHLLPGIDDGVKTLEESAAIIRQFRDLGYRKLITTPHIISDIYRNTPAIIGEKLTELKSYLYDQNIEMEIDAAAEYYLDESVMHALESNEKLLTIAGKYLLFETNFLTEPLQLKHFIFMASAKGYKPVLAHPERYLYIHQDWSKLEDLLNRGVLFQINLTSLTGNYSKPAQAIAMRMIDNGMVHWLGSDCHHLGHVQMIGEVQRTKSYQKALHLPLLNHTL